MAIASSVGIEIEIWQVPQAWQAALWTLMSRSACWATTCIVSPSASSFVLPLSVAAWQCRLQTMKGVDLLSMHATCCHLGDHYHCLESRSPSWQLPKRRSCLMNIYPMRRRCSNRPTHRCSGLVCVDHGGQGSHRACAKGSATTNVGLEEPQINVLQGASEQVKEGKLHSSSTLICRAHSHLTVHCCCLV